jgi:3-mercaptopyruvate sulfurtransferase SseA
MMNLIHKTAIYKKLVLIISVYLLWLMLLSPLNAMEATRNNLVSVSWLSKNLDNPALIVDASPAQNYSKSHIPGAVNYDLFIYGPKELPVSEIEKKYRSWGISQGIKIVIYDQGGTMLATRLLFSMEYYGVPIENLYILDGGFSKWKEAGYPSSDGPAAPKEGTFTVKIKNDVSAGLPEFLNASGDPQRNALIEALDPLWHYGQMNVFGRAGHVPNAILLPVADFYNPDKTFKSNEEIKKIMDYLGIEPDKSVYTHCGGGIAASVPYFALKFLLGYRHIKLFPGSLLEWSSDQRELPLWTYDAPFLLRNAAWLQGWGGKMMRMYGISNLSVIDIRTEDEFRKGHIQYAINIPAEAFRQNIKNISEIEKILGNSGVDASGEAVIISGGGLSKEAALAYVMLERPGQKKISIFTDNADAWSKSGFTVISDTSGKAERQVSSAPAARYEGKIKRENTIYNLENSTGVFPGVVITSDKNMKAGNARSFYIPVSGYLNPDGTPKSASEIWNILSAAGVPRYAEIVCSSNDPAEASLAYFVFKLMGYPDIKLLLN